VESVARPRTVIDSQLAARAELAMRRYAKAAAELDDARVERAEVIADMRAAGYGYDVIAAALEMQKARVQQMVKASTEGSAKSSDANQVRGRISPSR
jgi:hypothetical protein